MVVQVHAGSVPRSNSWGTQDVPPALLSSEVVATDPYRDMIKMVKAWSSYLFRNWRAELCCTSFVLCKPTKVSEITLYYKRHSLRPSMGAVLNKILL